MQWLMGWIFYADGCKRLSRSLFLLLACSDCLSSLRSLRLPLLMFVVCPLNRRSPVVMWAVPAARGWLPLLSGRAGRRPPSPAPVIPPRPLRLKARGSAGAFPPTAPGQWLASVSLTHLWMPEMVDNIVQHNDGVYYCIVLCYSYNIMFHVV